MLRKPLLRRRREVMKRLVRKGSEILVAGIQLIGVMFG